MFCLMNFDFSVVRSCMNVLFFTFYHFCLTFVGSFQSFHYGFIELAWARYLWTEWVWDPEESLLDYVFGMMNEGKELCWILDICSNKWCIWVRFQDFLLRFIECLLRVGQSKVIVLQRSCKDSIFLELWVKIQMKKVWQSSPSTWSWKWLIENNHEWQRASPDDFWFLQRDLQAWQVCSRRPWWNYYCL